MSRVQVDPGEVSTVGFSIERGAGNLDAVAIAVGQMAQASEPRATAQALEGLTQRWSAGLGRMRDDVESLGRGAEAASTLYTQTDERAMGPG